MITVPDNCDNYINITSPIPAMRASGDVLFNCWLRLNDGTWQHFDAGQRGGGYTHAESDGGYLEREKIMYGS